MIKDIGQRYRLGAKISQGAFGTVCQAIDLKNDNKKVAVKKMYLGKNKSKILRQISIMQQLSHPNILQLLYHQISQFECVLVTEFMSNDLSDLIQLCRMPLSKSLIKSLWNQLVEGLLYLNSKEILHRDIKPSNLLINKQGKLKIADFGSAVRKKDKDQKSGKFQIQGFTKWYTAPDILFGSRNYGQEIDIWSSGCVLAQMINGRPFFPGTTQIQQIFLISQILGSPDKQNWPNIVKFPDFGKLQFIKKKPQNLKVIICWADQQSIQILANTIRYQDRKLVKYKFDEIIQINLTHKKKQWDYRI